MPHLEESSAAHFLLLFMYRCFETSSRGYACTVNSILNPVWKSGTDIDKWEKITYNIPSGSFDSYPITVYKKGNKIKFKVDGLIAGNKQYDYAMGFQLITRVTDDAVMHGGQKQFINNVKDENVKYKSFVN